MGLCCSSQKVNRDQTEIEESYDLKNRWKNLSPQFAVDASTDENWALQIESQVPILSPAKEIAAELERAEVTADSVELHSIELENVGFYESPRSDRQSCSDRGTDSNLDYEQKAVLANERNIVPENEQCTIQNSKQSIIQNAKLGIVQNAEQCIIQETEQYRTSDNNKARNNVSTEIVYSDSVEWASADCTVKITKPDSKVDIEDGCEKDRIHHVKNVLVEKTSYEVKKLVVKKKKNGINVNACSMRQLLKLKGVGGVIAKRIMEQRPYYSNDELMDVWGIGCKKYDGFVHQLGSIDGIDVLSEQLERSCVEEHRLDILELEGNIRKCGKIASSHVLIASWNVRHLSQNKPIEQVKRIANVIDEYDLVALQEVRDFIILKRLRVLLPGWTYVASPLVGRGARNVDQSIVHEEIYAFMYRKCKFQAVGIPKLLQDPMDVLVREPYIATFALQATPKVQFVLVNMHIVFGTKPERLLEIKHFSNEMAKIKHENLLILGDFNLSPKDITLASTFPIIRPPFYTTVFGQLYDNIYTSPNVRIHKCGIHRIDLEYFPNASKQLCSKQLSDHCPIWLSLPCPASPQSIVSKPT